MTHNERVCLAQALATSINEGYEASKFRGSAKVWTPDEGKDTRPVRVYVHADGCPYGFIRVKSDQEDAPSRGSFFDNQTKSGHNIFDVVYPILDKYKAEHDADRAK